MTIFTDTAINAWQFANVYFRRVETDGNNWFQAQIVMSNEAILDGGGARYIDIGGLNYADLSVRAAFPTSAQRNLFCTKVGARQALVNGRGRSCYAIMANATPVTSQDGIYWYADATFTWAAP